MSRLVTILAVILVAGALYRSAEKPTRVFPPPPPPRTMPAYPPSASMPAEQPSPDESPSPEAAPVVLAEADLPLSNDGERPVPDIALPFAEPEPSPTPATSPPKAPHLVRLEAGTRVRVRLSQPLDTEHATEEQPFDAVLSRPLKAGRWILADEGASVSGIVRRVDRPGRARGKARLDLELRRIKTVSGWVDLTTRPLKKEKSGAGKDAARIGIGVLIGTVVGGAVGGGPGARRGAAVGAGGGGAAALATRGPDVILRVGTELVFKLQQPVLFEAPEP